MSVTIAYTHCVQVPGSGPVKATDNDFQLVECSFVPKFIILVLSKSLRNSLTLYLFIYKSIFMPDLFIVIMYF